MKSLDVEAVQAFVLVADLKSFTRTAEAMDTTQSAVSLKIKRLEDGLGRRLLERTPRLVRLSAEGNAFLGAARNLLAAHQTALGSFAVQPRRLIVGVSHHIVGGELPILLKHMKSSEPDLVIEMRVASSRDTLEAFDQGLLDAAIVLRQDNRRLDGDVILEEGFGWIGVPDFEYHPGQVLRLATQAEPCSVRSMAIAALAGGGIPWTEVFVGGGINTIGAAVSAGLAVAALGRRMAPPGTMDLGPQLGLPPLPSRDIVLHSSISDHRTRNSLRILVAAIRSTAA
ncbi:LysR family transcriptional regulator [Undibacterium sp.]|jgi:DNA-binding transcriptional LysR family regulator|uniref:LysR family transcriptional regulator n=1 Tax=Undibacterium sp. TaxID=1914977 RepID=UPI002C6C2AB0|nr:LysR family transcriptional regulator [Undibacterium sp.]HTD05552.1 LysR family transcriptional regulator [Undibacterium sp.]